ncbi:MAG: hypothetical protein ABI968_04465 [Acidobacteriota bacterium]
MKARNILAFAVSFVLATAVLAQGSESSGKFDLKPADIGKAPAKK